MKVKTSRKDDQSRTGVVEGDANKSRERKTGAGFLLQLCVNFVPSDSTCRQPLLLLLLHNHQFSRHPLLPYYLCRG